MGVKQPRLAENRAVRENPLLGEIASSSLILTAAEAAALFRKAIRTWRTWDSSGKIPRPIRIGRSVFWRQEEIDAWVAAGCPDREAWELRNRDHHASDSPEKPRKTAR